jgi:hypothetical protein
VRSLLVSYDLTVEPVTGDDAEWAARRWRRGEGLSLADRVCLAPRDRRQADVWTTDAGGGRRAGSASCAEPPGPDPAYPTVTIPRSARAARRRSTASSGDSAVVSTRTSGRSGAS